MRSITLALLIGLGPLAATAQQTSPDTADRFSKSLKKLGSDEYQERETASAELAALPAEALALVEAELKKSDLDAEVRTRLERSVAPLKAKARHGASARKKELSAAWTQKTAVDAYDRVGRKDPKWDVRVHEALLLVGRAWEGGATYTQMREAYGLLGAAVEAGCDDPLALYAQARMYGSLERKTAAEELKLHLDAAAAMKDKGARYHALRQCYCFARAADGLARSKKTLDDAEKQQLKDWLNLALSRFGEGAADPEVPELQIQEACQLMTVTWMTLTRDRAVGFAKIFDALTKARPDSALPLVLKGDVYINYAWDARGGGYANTVTDDGWKRMGERLTEAEAALTEAWKKNPADARAATLMIGVELGQSKGRATMETWYKRAMEADPDNLDACQKKMYYLEPKWHGSPDAMLAFGRELLAGGNWEARLPLELVSAHMTLAGYQEKPETYYQEEFVWKDMQAVYDRALKHNPDSTWDRSYYARMACYCGHWREAKALFDALGSRAESGAFADAAEFQRLKAQAADKGK
jgi:hypothetical protein